MDDFTRYKNELKSWYEGVKGKDSSAALLTPSQAKLRNLCVAICRKGNSQDLTIFRNFLKFDYSENASKRLKEETDKFKPIARFLKGESELTDLDAVEMLAVLINYPNRPFSSFRKQDGLRDEAHLSETFDSLTDEIAKNPEPPAPTKEISPVVVVSDNKDDGKNWWQRHQNKVFGFSAMGIIAFTIPNLSWFKKDCMQWQKNHYERMACEFSGDASVIVFDSAQFNIKKFKAHPRTQFFKGGKPIVWYLKHDGTYDFFTAPGYHPLLPQKDLLPVSRHIAMGVVSGEIQSSD